MYTIKITDHVDDFVTNSSGYALFLVLNKALSDNTSVALSFKNVPATSSSFLNSSLGALVENSGITVLNRIKPIHVFVRQWVKSRAFSIENQRSGC